ncbi:putative peptidyl-tRNA hydrolase PTRHD1 [Chionoecetes opilio]|uniref:peptidyl-tRNA hydrolase n=1 Tax=Chionoecetes opilio TaxID=41210 RepID=A0A8J4YJU0_CHIOP|nr:putative peptidyl-tRNA hydrolase PTRHD1 [Chionoecetes opilio]
MSGSVPGLVQYVVVRKDLFTNLAWPLGAVIAQACHAAAAVTHLFHDDDNMKTYLADLDNMHKVVLGIDNEVQLKNLSEKLREASIDHKLWIEQPEDIPTCLVTKPYVKLEVSKYFKKFKLLKTEESQPSKNGDSSCQ